MHPLVKAAPAVALLAALGGAARRPPPAAGAVEATSSDGAVSARSTPLAGRCGPREAALDPGGPCVALPSALDASRGARERLLARERTAPELRTDAPHERVERLPERSEEWSRYLLPVDLLDAETALDPFDAGANHGLVARLHAARGEAVKAVRLDGQRGDAEVVGVGALRGITVVTRHRLDREAGPVDVLVFIGRLASPGPNVTTGARLPDLAVVGFVGGEPPLVELEVRELREPLTAPPAHLADLESLALGFAVDPRNVFPMRR